jgi:hypothetical protein
VAFVQAAIPDFLSDDNLGRCGCGPFLSPLSHFCEEFSYFLRAKVYLVSKTKILKVLCSEGCEILFVKHFKRRLKEYGLKLVDIDYTQEKYYGFIDIQLIVLTGDTKSEADKN